MKQVHAWQTPNGVSRDKVHQTDHTLLDVVFAVSSVVINAYWQLLYETESSSSPDFLPRDVGSEAIPHLWAGRVVCALFCSSPPALLPGFQRKNNFIKHDSLLTDVCNVSMPYGSSGDPCWFGFYQFNKRDQAFRKL